MGMFRRLIVGRRVRRLTLVGSAAVLVLAFASPPATAGAVPTAMEFARTPGPAVERAQEDPPGSAAESDGNPVAARAAAPITEEGSARNGVTAAPQRRIVDTRIGLGGAGPIRPTASLRFYPFGYENNIYGEATSVLLTVTVPATAGSGSLVVSPNAGPESPVAQVQFTPGQATSTQVWVPVRGFSSGIRIRNASAATPVHIVVDFNGYGGSSSGPGSIVLATPERVVDSDTGLGTTGPLAGRGSLTVPIAGRAGVPADGAAAVLLSITVPRPQSNGWLTAAPTSVPPPGASAAALNWSAGRAAAGPTVVPLGPDGSITLTNQSTAPAPLQVDVLGYVRAGTPIDGGLVPLPATRVLDTRSGLGWTGNRPLTGSAPLPLVGRGGVPATNVAAVLVQITGIGTGTNGFISTAAGTTAVNHPAMGSRTDLALIAITPGTAPTLTRPAPGSSHVVVDVLGYVPSFAPITPQLRWGGYRQGAAPLGTTADLTCVSSQFCMAVDYDERSAAFDGNVWRSILGTGPLAVACVSSTACLGMTRPYVENQGFQNGTAVFDGTRWTAVTPPDSPALFAAVACAGPTFCLLVDGAGRAWTRNGVNGNGWTATPPVFVDPMDLSRVEDVSCTSATSCTAVGSAIWQFDGTSWRPADVIGASNLGEFAVSCRGPSFCATSGYAHSTVITGDQAWEVSMTNFLYQSDISCGSPDFCVRTTGADRAEIWDGRVWTLLSQGPALANRPMHVSCPTRDFCLTLSTSGGSQTIGRR